MSVIQAVFLFDADLTMVSYIRIFVLSCHSGLSVQKHRTVAISILKSLKFYSCVIRLVFGIRMTVRVKL